MPLNPQPLSTTLLKQTTIYLVSFLLPPMGLWWGFKYLKEDNKIAKRVGITAILLTVISLVLMIWMSISLGNKLNQLFKEEMELPDLPY